MLGCISRASPKIGNYAFTTLHPFIGTIQFDDFLQLKVADLPGLIEGSLEEQKGIGNEFVLLSIWFLTRFVSRCSTFKTC